MSVVQNLSPQQQPLQPQSQAQEGQRLQWENLPQLSTNLQLSNVLGYQRRNLLTWLGKSKSTHYSIFQIQKKNGTFRHLHNPDQVMRIAQHRILNKVLNLVHIPGYIYAFEKNKSIPEMASKHVGKNLVISVDIKDFFHSIKQNKLHQLFIQAGIEEKPARTLSEICTYKSYVPQGALTSPKVSNMVAAATFGPVMERYCVENDFTLTIYADDITISTLRSDVVVSEVLGFITSSLTSFGFIVNKAKTKVMHRGCRQYVCGVVVNEKLNLIRVERQRLRAIVHNIACNGVEVEALKNSKSPSEFLNHVKGRLNWFKQNNPVAAKKLITKLDNACILAGQSEQLGTETTSSTMEVLAEEIIPETMAT